ncbi:ferredoxin [Variovorax rhizosphaerae]|uniref:Ferredoxin n=1 Tax=Variovorax rhizosphaerae TaxID=1836200 RepID=A0ABU8WUR1_9BURK
MAHVITSACIDCKDGACTQCCPVDCIYEGSRTFYIHPDECIDCGVCLSFCPAEAIHEDVRLPASQAMFLAINREFFSPEVSGLGSPGGAADVGPVSCDHPAVAKLMSAYRS